MVPLVPLENLSRHNAVDVEDIVRARAQNRPAGSHAGGDLGLRLEFPPAREQFLAADAGDRLLRIGAVPSQPLLERRVLSGRKTKAGIVLVPDVVAVIGVAKRVLGDDRDIPAGESRPPVPAHVLAAL